MQVFCPVPSFFCSRTPTTHRHLQRCTIGTTVSRRLTAAHDVASYDIRLGLIRIFTFMQLPQSFVAYNHNNIPKNVLPLIVPPIYRNFDVIIKYLNYLLTLRWNCLIAISLWHFSIQIGQKEKAYPYRHRPWVPEEAEGIPCASS